MNRKGDKGRRVQAGFSLVEMAIATLLIAIFLTLGLGALNVHQENLGATTTQKNLDAIRDAFVNYVRTNKRLPCPDTEPASAAAPDGKENVTGAVCTSAFGVVPYLDLGLTRETALDGWGNLFSYHVSMTGAKNWSVTGAFVSTGNSGALTIQDRNTASPFALYPLSTAAAAVVISHGRNGLGAYTTKGTRLTLPTSPDELVNTNPTNTTTYVRRTRTDSEAGVGGTFGTFDDYVMYLSAEDLLTPLVKDGSIRWADVQVEEDFLKIKNAIYGYTVATASDRSGATCTSASSSLNCKLLPYPNPSCADGLASSGITGCVPDVTLNLGTAAARLKDPWGAYYQYSLGNVNLGANGDNNGIGSGNSACIASAYTVTSTGGRTLAVSCAELRGALVGKLPP